MNSKTVWPFLLAASILAGCAQGGSPSVSLNDSKAGETSSGSGATDTDTTETLTQQLPPPRSKTQADGNQSTIKPVVPKESLDAAKKLKMPATAKPFRAPDTSLESTVELKAALSAQGNLGTLQALIELSGLATDLETDGPYTLLAPTDKAFAALPKGMLDQLKKNPKALKNFLTMFVSKGVQRRDALTNMKYFVTLVANRPIVMEGESLFIDGCKVVKPDLESKHALFHIVDKVPLPPATY